MRIISPLGPKSFFTSLAEDGSCLACDGSCGTGQVGGIIVFSDQALLPATRQACSQIATSTCFPVAFFNCENISPGDVTAIMSQVCPEKLGLAANNDNSTEAQITAIIFSFNRILEICPFSAFINDLSSLKSNLPKLFPIVQVNRILTGLQMPKEATKQDTQVICLNSWPGSGLQRVAQKKMA